MNEYLKEKLRRVRHEADLLMERTAELLTEIREASDDRTKP